MELQKKNYVFTTNYGDMLIKSVAVVYNAFHFQCLQYVLTAWANSPDSDLIKPLA